MTRAAALRAGFRGWRHVAAAAFALAAVGCGNKSSPAAPSVEPITLAGAWSGTASDSSGPGVMTWQLTQTGNAFEGTLTIVDDNSGYRGKGTVSGTLDVSGVQFTMVVPAGGFDAPYLTCTATVSGNGTATSASLTGSYSGANSCAGPITGGLLSLNRQ